MDELDLVGGRYRLLRVIGAGGMGRVWLADDELLGRRVAVKEIGTPASATASLDLQLATMHEARAAARIDHPGVVHVFDVIWRPGTSWIVMEYVPGRSLQDALPLPHRDAARIGLGVLAALRVAHAAGVLHRDVKPHNVLLAEDGRVVLSDFGLAGVEDADPSPDTVVGSPHYVAPERVRGADSGAAADLWSLGATLYAAVEGRSPFARATTLRSLDAVLHEEPDPPTRPGPLTPVIAALLAKDPADRPTAEQAEALLRRAADRVMGIFPLHRLPGITLSRPPSTPRPPASFRGIAGAPSASGHPAPPGRPSTGRTRMQSPRTEPTPAGPALAEPTPAELSSAELSSAGPAPRLARGTRVALAVAGVLLAGTTGTALALDAATPDRPAPPTAAAPGTGTAPPGAAPLVDRAAGICDDGATAGTAVTLDRADRPYALPPGWVWHRDPAGFEVAVPTGWTREAAGDAACFRDPVGSRSFEVQAGGPDAATPIEHWRGAERTALGDGALPGYRLVAMTPLDVKGGGAAWEFTWQPAAGERRHERRLLLSVAPDRAYAIGWTTREQDWPADEPVLQLIVASLS